MRPAKLIQTAGLAVALSAMLAACAAPTQAPPTATETAPPATATPTAAATSAPTDTPAPTSIPPTLTDTPAPTPTELPKIVAIPDVPTYPGIIETVGADAIEKLNKCGNTQFLTYDIYYSVDYGDPKMTKDQKKASAKNQEIVAWYHQQFEAQNWKVFDRPNSLEALFQVITWENDNRAYPEQPGLQPYVGACYLVTVLVQPPGADLEIVASVEREG